MLSKGAAKKITIYVNEDTQEHSEPLYERILMFLLHKGVSGATATRALAGFGSHQILHTPKIEVLADHLPIRIEFIEAAEKIDQLLPTLYEMVTDGLIEVQDTRVVKIARKDRGRPEPAGPHERKAGKAQMMRIYLGEADLWNEEPLYDAIVKRLRMMDISGATVYRGILGYGVKGHTHKQNLLHTSRDLPIMISVVETADKLRQAVGAVEEMLQDGLIVMSEVDVVRLFHPLPAMEAADTEPPPPPVPSSDNTAVLPFAGSGAKLLRLHFTERDRYRGEPLYEAILRKCKELGIAGATVLRGLEGYGDTAEIHRSHLLTHDLPVVIQIVDSEENVLRLLPAVEDMMEKGLLAMSDVKIVRVQKTALE